MNPQNILNRTLYRQLLRLSLNGRRPEIYGAHGALHAYINSNQNKNLSFLPKTAEDVRKHLRYSFEIDNKTDTDDSELYDVFSVLRRSKVLSSILFPNIVSSTSESTTAPKQKMVGIFDYTSSALLPSESSEFNFFEPRYKLMARDAIENNNQFILRGCVPSEYDDGVITAAVLCTIIESVETEDGNNVMVRFTAGPRIEITEEILDAPTAGDEEYGNPPPLLRARSYELMNDEMDAFDTIENLKELRSSVLELLIELTTIVLQESNDKLESNKEDTDIENKEQEKEKEFANEHDMEDFWNRRAVHQLTKQGLPPLNCEEFSWWAMKFCLPPQGSSELRLNWLACKSTAQRLNQSVTLLEEWISVKRGLMGDGSAVEV